MYIVCLQALMNVGYAYTIIFIRSSTDPGLLYLAEWLCPPFALPKHFLLDTPMLVHDMQFILATLPMDRQVITFKTYINAT